MPSAAFAPPAPAPRGRWSRAAASYSAGLRLNPYVPSALRTGLAPGALPPSPAALAARRAGGGGAVLAQGLGRGPHLTYTEPVFRPPAEWKSLILQVTNGCSWNKCTFCEMYTAPGKEFNMKPLEELEAELVAVAASGYQASRVFLADGDAMTMPTGRLLEVLALVRKHLPGVNRVASYCLPRNVRNKSEEDLKELRAMGLSLVYIGCESGDDEVLRRVEKGESYDSSLEALEKLRAANMKRSVMILNGLGGPQLSEQHAVNSARLMNASQPELLSTLTVSFPLGEERFEAGFEDAAGGGWRELTVMETLRELEMMVGHLELRRTIFRSDHASNYLSLQGVLGRDKDKLLGQLGSAITSPKEANLRPEWMRGL